MFPSLVRTVALLVLLSALFCFSGVSRACELLADPAAVADSCCPTDHQESDDPGGGGSLLECPCCTACFGTIAASGVSVPVLSVSYASHPRYRAPVLPSGYRSSIYRPPETA